MLKADNDATPNVNLDGPRVGGLDTTYQTVSLDRGNGTPDPGLGPRTFSASWTGQGEVSTSSVYAFSTTANDEVRLSGGGKPPIEVDAWSH